jgi:hypothetical protein
MALRKVYLVSTPIGAALLAACIMPGCVVDGQIVYYKCDNLREPVLGHLDRNGDLDPCCRDKSVPCDTGCDGECMPTNGDPNWSKEPVLFSYSDFGRGPISCPDSTEHQWEAYADPISTGQCQGCLCSDPACVPPASVIASDLIGCNGPQFTVFPVAPDGSCSMSTPIPPHELKSLAILSPTVSACTPSTAPVVVPKDFVPDIWGKRGVLCTGTGNGICSARGDVCVPSSAPPSGFMQCLVSTTNNELLDCPEKSRYTRKFVVYDKIDDKTACTPCKCGAPVGSDCVAAVSAYQDKSCATPIFENFVTFSGNPQCVTVGPNLPLQGVTSEWITNQPGTCMPSGGDLTGKVDVDHTTARAFCCWE